jgi:hypothetical protein
MSATLPPRASHLNRLGKPPASKEASATRTISEVRLHRTTDERINTLSLGLSGRDSDGHEAKVQGVPSSITVTADVSLRHELW